MSSDNQTKKITICSVSALPLRREPYEQSEMVSQILYGEEVEILSEQDNWLNIRILYDDYEGWIDKKCVEKISVGANNTKLISDKLFEKHTINNRLVWLPAGAEYYTEKEQVKTETKQPTIQSIIKTAEMFLGVPYLWGGRSAFGCDCSGFVQTVFKINNIKLPRDAYMQVEYGETINFFDMIKPADLVFFGDIEKITHVGIALEDNKIIHSSGSVRIDSLNHQGIYNNDIKSYTHHLRIIKRLNI